MYTLVSIWINNILLQILDENMPMETENMGQDDGWEVVKRSKKKPNFNKVWFYYIQISTI